MHEKNDWNKKGIVSNSLNLKISMKVVDKFKTIIQ